jgi:hypothetical protein
VNRVTRKNPLATIRDVLTARATTVTSAYTAAPGDLIAADATAGGFTITLPAAPYDKTLVLVKKVDSSANTVTVQRSGSDVFNQVGGSSTLQLPVPDQTVALQYSAGSGIWYVTGHGAPVAGLDGRYTALHPAHILDSNGNTIVDLSAAANAVNYLQVQNSASGGAIVFLNVVGTDTNLDLWVKCQGTGRVRIYSPSNTPSLRAAGPGSNLDLNLESVGTGKVTANGVELATISGIQTFTNKTLSSPKIGTILDTNGNTIVEFSPTASAVNYLQIGNSALGTKIVTLTAIGSDTDIDLWAWLKGNGIFRVYSPNNIPIVKAAGPGTNIDLNLQGQGTGKVKGAIVPRIGTTTSSATPSINTDNVDQFNITALATPVTSMTSGLTGTFADGQRLRIRFKDNGTGQSITWGASFTGNLLSTTVSGKTHLQELIYDDAAAKWAGTFVDTAGY